MKTRYNMGRTVSGLAIANKYQSDQIFFPNFASIATADYGNFKTRVCR